MQYDPFNEQSANGRNIADGIAANLAKLYIAFGRMDSIRQLLAVLEARGDVRGSAAQFITLAREALWQMENEPQHTFKCGPFALVKLRQINGETNVVHQAILNEPSTDHGTSLSQVAALARRTRMNYQMAKRQPGGQVLLPCVVHWKAGHFSALTREEDGKYVVDDSIFGGPFWVSEATLNSEASGYFLVPEGP